MGCCCRVLFLPKIKINAILKKTGYPAGYQESAHSRISGSGFFLQPDNPESGSGLNITIRYSPTSLSEQLKFFLKRTFS